MARSPLPNFFKFRLLCALLSLLIPTVTAVNISRCYKDTVCFYSRCDGDTSDSSLTLFKNSQKTSFNLSSCEVILQMKKLAPKRLVIWLRLLRNLNEESQISLIFFQMSFEIPDSGTNSEIIRSTPSILPGEYNLRLEVIPEFEDLHPPDSSYQSIGVTFEDVQLEIMLPANEPTTNEVNEAFRKTFTCSPEGFTDIGKLLSTTVYEIKQIDFAESGLICPKGFNLSAAKDGNPSKMPEIYCENNQWQTNFFNTSDHPDWKEFVDSSNTTKESNGDQHKLKIVNELAIGCVRKRKLLISTVNELNISRCYTDTICFYDQCDGIASDSNFKLFNKSQKTPVNLGSCEVLLQIKKLSVNRHATWLRVLGNVKEESAITIAIADAKFGLTPTKFIYVSSSRNNSVIHLSVVRFTPSIRPDEYNMHMEVISEPGDLLVPDCEETTTIEIGVHFTNYPIRTSFWFCNFNETLVKAFDETVTCSTQGFTDIKHLSTSEYAVKPVDFTESRLTCPEGFNLTAKKGENPTLIPDIYCENNQWQTEFFNTSDHPDWEEFLDSSGVIEESVGNGQHKLTIVDKRLAIGCVRKRCSTCVDLPRPVDNCANCVSPKLLKPTSNMLCANIECPSDYGFSLNGMTRVSIDPACKSRIWQSTTKLATGKIFSIQGIRKLSCIPNNASEVENEVVNEPPKYDKGPGGSAQLGGGTNKTTKKHQHQEKSNEPEKVRAGDWLKKNWISSILVPLIILSGVTGCIVFLVCMLKTKDEQEALLREEKRREQEEINEVSGRERTNSWRSDSTLIEEE